MKGSNFNNDTFYVPVNEDIWNLSGIVVVLSGELREDRRPISFISKKEDVTKVNKSQCGNLRIFLPLRFPVKYLLHFFNFRPYK